MFDAITVIGSGRVGAAVTARLRERGVPLGDDGALVLLCVPDTAIAEVARGIEPGPWVAHVSGGTTLGALDPHERRFSVHPLQTFTLRRGPEQLDGAFAAVTGESEAARERGLWLAHTLGLRTRRGRSITPARRSRPTISSPCTGSRRTSSPRPAPRPRRSYR